MFIIQGKRGERRWISGIFAQRTSVDEYMALIPDEARPRHSVADVEGLSYPFYIIEDEAGFRFLSESEARDALTHYAAPSKQSEEDGSYLILYRIDNDWRPQKAGWDSMGALPHDHVTEDTLNSIRREGLQAIWERGS